MPSTDPRRDRWRAAKDEYIAKSVGEGTKRPEGPPPPPFIPAPGRGVLTDIVVFAYA